MRRITALLAILLCTLALHACKRSESSEIGDSFFESSIQAVDTVYQGLINKDAQSIKSAMCSRLKSMPNVDEQLQSLLDNIDGTILQMEMEGARGISSIGSRDNDVWTDRSTIGTIDNLKTDTGKMYQHLKVFYTYLDNANPDLVGITGIILRENDTIAYEVLIPEEKEPEEEDYGTVYTPDGPRPATKEEQEAMLGEGATE